MTTLHTEYTDTASGSDGLSIPAASPPHELLVDSKMAPNRSIQTVLIANRGEITLRIIRTLHKMSLRAVVIDSDADAQASHVVAADTALHLEGDTIGDTYLNAAKIVQIALSARVDAVIPGYGFLAENAGFARAVEQAGMVWIGPTPEQMTELGLKHRARAIAAKVGVPVVPGSNGLLQSIDNALEAGGTIGYPLMLKSTGGGGGIGLQRCDNEGDLRDAFESVKRIAAANFDDHGVYLERLIENARHVEVQILGDGTGRVITAGDRDCSLQRRHQKVIEESPALMVSADIRAKMGAYAVQIASTVSYRNVGTVEFLYDTDTDEVYFLEVNTRLQVEHPITEAVTGLDLVECMVKIAGSDAGELFDDNCGGFLVSGVSIEARLYAENPLRDFSPCGGRVLGLHFPPNLRIIATGHTRQEAVERLVEGLAATEISGLQTNLDFLRQLTASSMLQSCSYTTSSLDSFQYTSNSFEILDSGGSCTVQDFLGRMGVWNVGIPPSGPMDSASFRLANRLVDNGEGLAALECTLKGPSLKFHCEAVVAVTGGSAPAYLDNEAMAMHKTLHIKAGQTLRIGVAQHGYRVYVAIRGGVDVPLVMGSRSTFELAKMGGWNGRKLQPGDIVPIGEKLDGGDIALLQASALPISAQPKAKWTIGVVPGPHGAPDFFTSDSIGALFFGEWIVHYNSNRLGIRLKGPRPQWARETSGKAGLHPSNIHDSPYSIGSVSFTGDEAVVLTCDGPSLGGFVVFCVVVSPELWKLGQLRPGDMVHFQPTTIKQSLELNKVLSHGIENLAPLAAYGGLSSDTPAEERCTVNEMHHDGRKVTARQAGDSYLLLEFGDTDDFSLRQSFEIATFIDEHRKRPIGGIDELTPGVRTLHLKYNFGLHPDIILTRITEHIKSYTRPTQMPSRHIRLPVAFNDEETQAAIQRYGDTIRAEAPWLPSNIDFLASLNGIDDIQCILQRSEFLVLGLGDVFLGSPCAIPKDPRDRLLGTKYNPSRSFTPRGCVGIGGQYLCIYATESPGGYQLVGRTVPIWNPAALATLTDGAGGNRDLLSIGADSGKDSDNPCMFRLFDRITFFPVIEEELDSVPAEKLVRISDGVLDLAEHEAMLHANRHDIAATAERQAQAIARAPFLYELLKPHEPIQTSASNRPGADDDRPEHGDDTFVNIQAYVPGRCWKLVVKEGQRVSKGSAVVYLESSKMEVEITTPVDGVCVKTRVAEGDLVEAYADLVVIMPDVE
ncbi:Uu.00g047610.m01.CDS01 [Anthostomella pinea]|uniref:Uu.00g047610.m01.CDS01 n=1 Tax=Anthostomella pinea TaxID=933095 RepID=A0AAI8V6J0_9PEZI|nr:Uu.00g047610.m01.CDS01 [Anthostomella pinea]